MARGVPDEEVYEPRVMPEEFPRKITPQFRGPSPIGGALERFGDVINQKYQADSATWAGDQLGNLRVQAVKNLEDMKAQVPAGQDPGDFTAKYLATFDKQSAPVIDQASTNPFASKMMEKGLRDLRDTLATHSMEWEATQRVAYRNDSILKNLNAQLPVVEAHPELADQVGSTLMDQINATGADPSQRLLFARQMHAQLSEAAANGLARQNPKAVLDGLNNPDTAPDALKGLTDQQRESVRQRASAQYVDQRAQGIQAVYQNQGTTAGVKALAAIDKDDSIPAELKDPIRAKVNGQVNQLRAQRREQFASQVSQLEENIGAETAGPQDKASAWNLYEKGALNPTELASVMGGIERSEREAAKKGLSLEGARQAYESGTPLDSEHPEVKKGVGLLFTSLTQDSTPGSPDYVNRATDVTAKVGVAPEPALSWARTSLVGGDPKSAAAAADMIDRLDSTNPRSMAYALDPKTKAIAGVINEAVRAGTDPAIAVDMARKNAQSDNKALEERWTQLVGAGPKGFATQQNALQSRLSSDEHFKPGFFSSVPQVPTAMQSEFDALTKDYYRYTGGDLKQARDLATRDLTHTWGVSEVNGKREIMAYAPESMFPGLTPQVVREDIAAALKDRQGLDPSTVRLVMDPQRTARTQGSQWNLEAPDKNGLLEVMRDKSGNPLVYQLPVTKEGYERVKGEERQKLIDKALQAKKTEEEAEAVHAAESRQDAWGSP